MKSVRLFAILSVLALVLAACGGGANGPTTTAADETTTTAGGTEETTTTGADETTTTTEAPAVPLTGNIEGAGATFPQPVFQEWMFDYTNGIQPGVQINYQGIGSGGGRTQFLEQTIDWGTSEAHLTDEQLEDGAAARGCAAHQWPVLFGAVEVAFGDEQFNDLILSGEVIADIFEARITNFSDPAIAELNPDFDLPDQDITIVHRSDGSGTTSVFTTFLTEDTENWTLGAGTEVQWPAGAVGAQGNDGVTVGIQQNPGGIGYVNQAYALLNNLPTAQVINAAGNPIKATLAATSEALEVLDIPDDFQFSITGVGGGGYPIVGAVWNFTWECGYDADTAEILIDFWTWAVSDPDAIALAEDLGYAVLGEGLRARVLEAIALTGSLD